MTIAYLIHQYPKVSHTFIRREIAALEACGVHVQRFSIRRSGETFADPADQAEQLRTQTVLDIGVLGLLLALLRTALARPARLLRTLWLAVRMGWRSDRGIARHLAYVAEATVILQWCARSGAEHVHAHFLTNAAAVAMLCHSLGGPPFSMTAHGPDDYDRARYLSLEEKVSRAEFVVAVSSFGRSQLYRWCTPALWSKIAVVRCGVDEAFLDNPPVPIPTSPRLVCVGRLTQDKGQLLLLEAVRQLDDEGLRTELTLVGDGPLRSTLVANLTRLGLADRVKITGWASGAGVREHVLAARALVLPSFAENLPLAIIEALALGRPVISSAIAGIPELIEPGISGWLVTPGSVETLTSALREVLQAPAEVLQRMGQAGEQRVARLHNVHLAARELLALFEHAHSS